MGNTGRTVRTVQALRSSTAPLWTIAVLLAFIAGWLIAPSAPSLPAALAQTAPMAGARGIYAFTGQLDANRHGLFMLDIEQGTVWVYAIEQSGGTRKLQLIAARSWIYDRYLRDFNCAEPTYREIQELVAKQRLDPPAERPAGVDAAQRP